jgi:GntP family gluconate:H+ symporter/D-serine transporter
MIVKFRLHAFIALVLAAVFVGVVTGMPLNKIMVTMENGVGGTLGFLALIIGLGSVLGKMLEVSGGSQRIAQVMLSVLGKQNASWVMMLVGFIAGIPVFVEVGFVLLVPLVFVVARDAGVSKLKVGVPLALSLMVVHCIVPPHPAATAICGALGADIGKVIIFGLLAGLPCAIVGGPLLMKLLGSRDKAQPEQTDGGKSALLDSRDLPGFGLTLFTILLPLILMVGKTISAFLFSAESSALLLINFIGNPIMALLISAFFAYWSLGLARGRNLNDLLTFTEKSFRK